MSLPPEFLMFPKALYCWQKLEGRVGQQWLLMYSAPSTEAHRQMKLGECRCTACNRLKSCQQPRPGGCKSPVNQTSAAAGRPSSLAAGGPLVSGAILSGSVHLTLRAVTLTPGATSLHAGRSSGTGDLASVDGSWLKVTSCEKWFLRLGLVLRLFDLVNR